MQRHECQYTKRFKAVFRALVEQGIVKTGRKKGNGDSLKTFATKVWGKPYGSYVSDVMVGRKNFPLQYVGNLCEHYNVSYLYMMDGKGDMIWNTPFSVSDNETIGGPRK